jgi:hypothetical protein
MLEALVQQDNRAQRPEGRVGCGEEGKERGCCGQRRRKWQDVWHQGQSRDSRLDGGGQHRQILLARVSRKRGDIDTGTTVVRTRQRDSRVRAHRGRLLQDSSTTPAIVGCLEGHVAISTNAQDIVHRCDGGHEGTQQHHDGEEKPQEWDAHMRDATNHARYLSRRSSQ